MIILNTDIYRWLGKVRWGVFILGTLLAGAYAISYFRLPAVPARPDPGASFIPAWPESRFSQAEHWNVFQHGDQAGPVRPSSARQRFRLAGTFFSYGELVDGQTKNIRVAILDDLENDKQTEVKEGDRIAEFEITRILHDHLKLNNGIEEEELWISYAVPDDGASISVVAPPQKPPEPEPLETSRFGKRIGEQRWVMSREALEAYHQELKDDPERLASVYLSMRPVYEENEVEGYRLEMAGEQELFKAFGLQEGDIIRRVNSMRMTSQRRAEYLLSEFANENLNVFDFEVERNGELKKLIHQVR